MRCSSSPCRARSAPAMKLLWCHKEHCSTLSTCVRCHHVFPNGCPDMSLRHLGAGHGDSRAEMRTYLHTQIRMYTVSAHRTCSCQKHQQERDKPWRHFFLGIENASADELPVRVGCAPSLRFQPPCIMQIITLHKTEPRRP